MWSMCFLLTVLKRHVEISKESNTCPRRCIARAWVLYGQLSLHESNLFENHPVTPTKPPSDSDTANGPCALTWHEAAVHWYRVQWSVGSLWHFLCQSWDFVCIPEPNVKTGLTFDACRISLLTGCLFHCCRWFAKCLAWPQGLFGWGFSTVWVDQIR